MDNWGMNRSDTPGIFARAIVRQLLAATAILAICIGILSFDGVFSRKFHMQASHYLTSYDSDWGPAIETMVATGLWMDSIDKGAFEVVAPKDDDLYLTLPVSGTVIREFGWIEISGNPQKLFHSGIDIETDVGTPVRSALDGQVINVDINDALGRFVELEHRSGLITVYANCSEVLVQEGDVITQGQIIAKAGISVSDKGQLHFEIKEGDQPVDPFQYLNFLNEAP
ncbi:MAG: hypothetical protein APF76_12940 [Desulfitibacter sp. BRH_c19]|nr:MAG: hypothetical protein APF76_12940 [Desulfitibacter sp. BRH_c19]